MPSQEEILERAQRRFERAAEHAAAARGDRDQAEANMRSVIKEKIENRHRAEHARRLLRDYMLALDFIPGPLQREDEIIDSLDLHARGWTYDVHRDEWQNPNGGFKTRRLSAAWEHLPCVTTGAKIPAPPNSTHPLHRAIGAPQRMAVGLMTERP